MKPQSSIYVMDRKQYFRISTLLSMIYMLSIIFLLFFNYFVTIIPTLSMYPTVKANAILVNRFTSAESLEYDDIITFYSQWDNIPPTHPHNIITLRINDLKTPNPLFLKRVIGLPGDTIEIKDGCIWRNDTKLTLSYMEEPVVGDMARFQVPAQHLFCMGDNVNNSMDCRYIGCIPFNAVVGKNIFILNRPDQIVNT